MARIEFAAKALLAAFREFRGTLIGMLLLGALVVWFCDLNTMATYVVGALAGYLPSFLAAYEKAYVDLRSRNTPRAASVRPKRPKRPISPVVRWVIITIASVFDLWLLFNLIVVIYR